MHVCVCMCVQMCVSIRVYVRQLVFMHACVCVSFITEWISGKDLKETVYSLRKTSRLFGVTVCLASQRCKRKRGKRGGEIKSEREEEDGQGRNLHLEA